MHALAQPTPLGNGPTGFFFVLNDEIIITEKVLLPMGTFETRLISMIDEMGFQPNTGPYSGHHKALCDLLLQTNLPGPII